jgi:hypothetical protein
MKLITKELERKLPEIGAQEGKGESALVYAKFFAPWTNWTWYALEYDREKRICFGLVAGFETEFGYFSIDELEKVKGPLGLRVERDLYFEPKTVKEVMKERRRR